MTVKVKRLNVCSICFDFQHLILRIVPVIVCQTGVYIVSDTNQ